MCDFENKKYARDIEIFCNGTQQIQMWTNGRLLLYMDTKISFIELNFVDFIFHNVTNFFTVYVA